MSEQKSRDITNFETRTHSHSLQKASLREGGGPPKVVEGARGTKSSYSLYCKRTRRIASAKDEVSRAPSVAFGASSLPEGA